MCPSEQRFLLLFTFLKKNQSKKVMVFFSSCNSVKFHSELLNYIDITVMDIHVSEWPFMQQKGKVWGRGQERRKGIRGRRRMIQLYITPLQ